MRFSLIYVGAVNKIIHKNQMSNEYSRVRAV